jgi:hypothetical protein
MSVDLGRLETGVPEQFLDHPQVGATIEEVRGEAVPEGMGMGGDGRTVVEEPADVPGSESSAGPVEEHRLGGGLGTGEVDPPGSHPLSHRLRAALVHRDPALATTFSPDGDHPLPEVDIAGIEPAQLCHPQTTPVQEFQNGVVAAPSGLVGVTNR